MPREDKVAAVEDIKDRVGRAEAAVFTDYRGLTVSQMAELRRSLRAAGIEYRVIKNSLTAIALADLKITEIDELMEGPTAVALGYEDPAVAAKLVNEYAKKSGILRLKGALMSGQVYSADQVKALASLPSREVLIAKLLGTMNAPVGALARVMNGPIAAFARVLQAVADQKAAAGEAA